MSEKKVYVFDDRWNVLRERFEGIEDSVAEALGAPVTFDGLEDYDPTQDRDSQIRRAADRVLGVNNGDISTSAILLDVLFEHQEGLYQCFEPLPSHPIEEQSLVDELYGSGLPVVVLSRSTNLNHVHAAGRENLPWLSLDPDMEGEAFGQKLGNLLKKELESPRYDRQALEQINRYAPNYDVEELRPLATRVVLLWENRRVLTAFREARKRLNRPLRILDIGCGTGRFEELLLSHEDTRRYVEQIVAADFVPQFLLQARERLRRLGLEEAVEERIVFKRRIAEDLRLPSESFDFVLAAFGLPCFSDYRKSIPEAARVLRPEGMMVLTGYNYNSLNFEYEEQLNQRAVGRRRSFFAADIDREEKTMTLPGGAPFRCYTFTPDYFTEVVEQDLFVPREEARGQAIDYAPVETFPVIHGCSPSEFIERLTNDPATSKESLSKPISYMPEALERTPGFSRDLYRMDRELCQLSALSDRGHYINIIASKS